MSLTVGCRQTPIAVVQRGKLTRGGGGGRGGVGVREVCRATYGSQVREFSRLVERPDREE